MITRINQAMTKRREENDKGFTLIELLVVILIIGVLAAIAIPAFLNQRQGAWESQVRSDLANAVIAAETFATNNNGTYAGMDMADLADSGFNDTTAVVTTVAPAADGESYILTANHASLDNNWTFTSATGLTEEGGAAPEAPETP